MPYIDHEIILEAKKMDEVKALIAADENEEVKK